jgi:hypothetical protein
MMKRFALLLAALFVASMVLVGPVFASGNHENNNGGDNEKVCVLHKDDKGDEHNNGEHKDYRWVSKDNKDHGDKVVKDKFCEHKNNGEHRDHNGEHKGNNGDNGHANNNDDNGHANNNDDWS